MKRYKKNGEIKTRNEIVIYKGGMVTYNPTEEMLLGDGWEESITPEVTETVLKNQMKNRKKRESEIYFDNEVKSFTINGERINIDTETLNKLTFRVMSEELLNINNTSMWFNNKKYEYKTKDALSMLYQLQVFFGSSYDITQSHMSFIDSLDTINEIEEYDFRAGYPEQLHF